MQSSTSGACRLLALLALLVPATALAAEDKDPAIGRWDITLGDGPTPCWLEVNRPAGEPGEYAGRFLFIAASVFDLQKVTVLGNKIEFVAADANGDGPGVTFTGTITGDSIKGETTNKDGKKGSKWTAKRFVPKPSATGVWTIQSPGKGSLNLRHVGDKIQGVLQTGSDKPAKLTESAQSGNIHTFLIDGKKCSIQLKGDVMEGALGDEKFTAKRERQWGKPIELVNGKDLEGWKPLSDPDSFKWKIVDGILHCDGGSSNIVTQRIFKDFKLHVEFKIPKGGNSGVYLRGRYEVQVEDSAGKQPDAHNCGGLYSRIAPNETVCAPPGEWQTFDITLIDQFLTVVHNGKTIIDNQDVEGITGGAMDSQETLGGPIYLQGDHTSVDYRKITLTPAGPITTGASSQPVETAK